METSLNRSCMQHNQVIPWAMKKNIDVVHRADNRLDRALIKVN